MAAGIYFIDGIYCFHHSSLAEYVERLKICEKKLRLYLCVHLQRDIFHQNNNISLSSMTRVLQFLKQLVVLALRSRQ